MMLTAIRGRTIVEPGNRVTLQSEALPLGAEAEVIVLVEGLKHPGDGSRDTYEHPLLRLLAARRSSFHSVAEVEAFLRQERDAWEG